MLHRIGVWGNRRVLITLAVVSYALLTGCGGGGGSTGGGSTDTTGGTTNGGSTSGSRSISGKLTNALTGAPLVGVTVSAAGKSTTTTSDGSYTLTGLPDTGTITVSYTISGYTTVSQDVTDTTVPISVAMQPSSGSIGNVTQPPPPPNFDALAR